MTDWNDFVWFLIGLSNGILIGIYTYKRVTRHPYRYECRVEGCEFTCSGNEMSAVDRLASNHERIIHEEY